MPISYEKLPQQALFRISYVGTIVLHDVTGFFGVFERDFLHHPNYDELCDMSQVAGVSMTVWELRALFEVVEGTYRRNRERKRVAFYAPNEPARSIVPRFVDHMQRHLPTVRTRCFSEKGDAYGFVGLAGKFEV